MIVDVDTVSRGLCHKRKMNRRNGTQTFFVLETFQMERTIVYSWIIRASTNKPWNTFQEFLLLSSWKYDSLLKNMFLFLSFFGFMDGVLLKQFHWTLFCKYFFFPHVSFYLIFLLVTSCCPSHKRNVDRFVKFYA